MGRCAPDDTRTCSRNGQYTDLDGPYLERLRNIWQMGSAESPGRASPPTGRVVRVLEFMSQHPKGRFGVSELARRVDLSKPTCLGIVTTLADAGYLIRDV